MGSVRIAVLTISDRCSRGETADVSGAALCEIFAAEPYETALYAVVPDSVKAISGALKRWTDEGLADVIVTTGGTGLSPRDRTTEATRKVLDRELPGIAMLLLAEGLKKTPLASLSQVLAGTRGHTLIVNLPGSPTAIRELAACLLGILPHAVDLLHGDDQEHPSTSAV
ncbi:MAG: MogA/MoaB family molybdenum cofactor biosynthesis protein [Capsulimonadaceae bacterium]|nr:MogA/MoaB family molybdenum cofactor biosynthesis protein [Capsulimonadaceae bacterium]